jgi:hypothetical protein
MLGMLPSFLTSTFIIAKLKVLSSMYLMPGVKNAVLVFKSGVKIEETAAPSVPEGDTKANSKYPLFVFMAA